MNPYTTQGAFSWAELTTPDPAAAALFYGQLLGWRLDASAVPEDQAYRVARIGETPVGGVLRGAAQVALGGQADRARAAWACYFTVCDLDETLRQCVALGGSVVLEAVDIPTVGRMAVLRDPQGATFSVIRYDDPVE